MFTSAKVSRLLVWLRAIRLSVPVTLWWFLLAMILANLGGNMYGPLLPVYLQNLGASLPETGLFFTLSQIVPLALQILGGWISDSLGRLRAIAIGSLFGMLAYLPLILAPSWEWVLLSSVLGSFTGALVAPSFEAFIAEQTREGQRGRFFGLSQAIFSVVGVIGPALGGWLAQVRGFRFMLVVAALFYLCATLIRLIMAQRAGSQEAAATHFSLDRLKENLSTLLAMLFSGGVVSWILITDGIRDVSFSLSMNLQPVYMEKIAGLNLVEIGTLISLYGAAMMLTLFPAGLFADRVGERWGIAVGMGLLGTGMALVFLMPVPSSLGVYVLGVVLAGTGAGLMTPAYQSLISKVIPQHLRGTAFGLFGTGLGLIALPAPWLGSLLWEHFNPRLPFAISIGSLLIVIPATLRKFRLEKNPNFGEENDGNP